LIDLIFEALKRLSFANKTFVPNAAISLLSDCAFKSILLTTCLPGFNGRGVMVFKCLLVTTAMSELRVLFSSLKSSCTAQKAQEIPGYIILSFFRSVGAMLHALFY
jgi:hypothetical protein